MIEVTLVKLIDGYPLWEEGFNYISVERKARLNRFLNINDKKRSMLSELLIRKAILDKLDIPINRIEINYNCYQKPYLMGIQNFEFNISHSESYVVFAFSKSTIGIDIEKIKDINFDIAKRFFTKEEYKSIIYLPTYNERLHRFYTLWTLKESYMKAIGTGLNIPLRSCEFMISDKYITFNGKEAYYFYIGDIEDFCISICHKEKQLKYSFSLLTEEDIYAYFQRIGY